MFTFEPEKKIAGKMEAHSFIKCKPRTYNVKGWLGNTPSKLPTLVTHILIIEKRFTFIKKERLKSRKLIEQLFSKGRSFSVYPLKVLYNIVDTPVCTMQAGVTVSIRNFKKAVHRNRVKRLVREAYRLQKLPLQNFLKEQNKSVIIFFIYTGKELPVSAELHKKMETILQKLADNLSKTA